MIAQHPGNCKPHAFQDKTYGAGFRVLNEVLEKDKVIGGRCTVCAPPKEFGKKRGGVHLIADLKFR